MSTVLELLGAIRGVTWEWNEASESRGKTPGAEDAGVIAQEVEAVFPALVATSPDGYKRVNYTGLIGVLIEAVKELKAKADALEKRIVELEARLAAPKKP
jgi:hypothetical protein